MISRNPQTTFPTSQASQAAQAEGRHGSGGPARKGAAEARRRRSKRHSKSSVGFGGPLSSPRDRQRLRERNAAERARVEEALAASPSPFDGRRLPRTGSGAAVHVFPGAAGCPVCSSAQLASDEVFEAGGPLRLVECLHCDHRWTERAGSATTRRETSPGGGRRFDLAGEGSVVSAVGR